MQFSTSLTKQTLILLGIIQVVYSQCLTANQDTPLPSKGDKLNLYKGQQAFAFSLLRQINKVTPNENIFFSPYSTYHALLLAYFGSANETEKELKNALNLNWADNKAKVLQAYRAEKRIRDARKSEIEFAAADKIFLGLDTPLRECMTNIFSAELENMDFKGNAEGCRKMINNWVGNITNNEIPEFLNRGDVSGQTNMVLANAAYFKGQWDTKFDVAKTKMEVFHIESDKPKLVQMMNNEGNYYLGVSEELGCLILEMPYKGGKGNDISMIILLPPLVNGRNNLTAVLENLTPESLSAAIGDFDSKEIKVGLPRFSFEKRLELVPILNQIGINKLFSNEANLKTFSEEVDFGLGDAIHLAKIKVDEEGSTAAAATALFSFRSARPLEVTEFKCNHPFLFLIYDHKSSAILFSGIYRDP